MTRVNMRGLRDTRRLKAWLLAGHTVALCERDRPIARIVPEPPVKAPARWPDFAARRRAMFGSRRLPGADLVREDRERD